jgi:hypothetical protein
MVATLIKEHMSYAVCFFGKPVSLDAIINPVDFTLPDNLRLCAGVDILMYQGVDLFLARRFEGTPRNLMLFSLQTHAYSSNNGRDGPYIGVGIFATAAINPVALVKTLRELLHTAQSALMRDGRFIVKEIGANEERSVSIPDSFDLVPNPSGYWFDKPIKTNHTKQMLILPSMAGVNSAEEFFSNVMFDPYAYSRNAFFCSDSRVANDCRQRSDEFDVLTIDKVLERHRLAFDGLVQKTNIHSKILIQIEQEHARQLSLKEQGFKQATSQIRDTVKLLQTEKSTLIAENEKMRRQLDRLIPPPKPNYDGNGFDKVTHVLIALAAIICVVLLGFGGYTLYTRLSPMPATEKPTSTEQRSPLSSANEAVNDSTGQVEVGVVTRPEAGGVKPKVNITK